MAEERLYTIPLRKSWIKTTHVKRANRSVHVIQDFLTKHMRAEKIKISEGINKEIWARGADKPPGKIRVKARMDGDILFASLPEEKNEVKETKKEEKPAKDKAKDLVGKEKVEEIEKKAEKEIKETKKETKAKEPKKKEEKEMKPLVEKK